MEIHLCSKELVVIKMTSDFVTVVVCCWDAVCSKFHNFFCTQKIRYSLKKRKERRLRRLCDITFLEY